MESLDEVKDRLRQGDAVEFIDPGNFALLKGETGRVDAVNWNAGHGTHLSVAVTITRNPPHTIYVACAYAGLPTNSSTPIVTGVPRIILVAA